MIPGGIVFEGTAGVYYWFLAGLVFLVSRLDQEAIAAARRAAAVPTTPRPLPAVSPAPVTRQG
jgi:hypothetical protein